MKNNCYKVVVSCPPSPTPLFPALTQEQAISRNCAVVQAVRSLREASLSN